MRHRAGAVGVIEDVAELLRDVNADQGTTYWAGNHRWRATFTIDFDDDIISRFLSPNYSVNRMESGSASTKLYTAPALFRRVARIWDSLVEHAGRSSTLNSRCAIDIEGVRKIELANGMSMISGRYPLRQSASRIVTLVDGERRWLFFSGAPVETHRDTARAVRALLASEALSIGCLAVHGACVALDDRGYLLCGSKLSGKTTNLFAALQNIAGARFVSNDRVYVSQRDSQLHVHGSPHSIPVRLSTLRHFPELVGRLSCDGAIVSGSSRGYAAHVSLAADDALTPQTDGREIFLASWELAAAFAVEELTECVLSGVILLTAEGEPRHQGWKRRAPTEARRVVAGHLHTQIETNFSYWDSVFEAPPSHVDLADFTDVDVWELNSRSNLKEAWRDHPLKTSDRARRS